MGWRRSVSGFSQEVEECPVKLQKTPTDFIPSKGVEQENDFRYIHRQKDKIRSI